MAARRCYLGLMLAVVGFLIGAGSSHADEWLEGIACRSVHLHYPAAEGVAFYNEITVDHSAHGTYFAVCGWDEGYYGIQELGNGRKVLIFSVWDSGQNDPQAVQDQDRTQLIYNDPKVRVTRFGGEGTGGQSFFAYDWSMAETYRLLVTAGVDGQRTRYGGYFYVPEDKAWKHLVTFSTITSGRLLRGYYSFVEDFKRDRVSTTQIRKAHFGNAWIKTANNEWVALRQARFTADRNPVTNINAGVSGGRFFLATGGNTQNIDSSLRAVMDRPRGEAHKVPDDLPVE